MSYFTEKASAFRVILSSLREWTSVLRYVYPCVIALVVYEWLMVHLINAVTPHWLRVTVMLAMFFCYFLVFSGLIVAAYARLIAKESSIKSAWCTIKKRLPSIAVAQLFYFVLCFGVLAAMVAIFRADFMATVAGGFFRKPLVDVLFVGGIFTVLLYTCYLFVPSVAMLKKPILETFFESVSMTTADSWGQAACLFIGLVIMAIALTTRTHALMSLRLHHLKWVYNAIIYSTIGVWLVNWMVLLVDNARFSVSSDT